MSNSKWPHGATIWPTRNPTRGRWRPYVVVRFPDAKRAAITFYFRELASGWSMEMPRRLVKRLARVLDMAITATEERK